MEAFPSLSLGKWDPNGYIVENFIKLSKGKVFYRLTGPNDGHLVVCLHGINWWSFSFDFLEKYLTHETNKYRILTFDFYGRGLSDTPNNVNFSPQLYLEQTEELLQELKLDTKKFTLLGFSMGGLIASKFASKHSDQIQSLILIGPAIVPVAMPFVGKLLVTPFIGYGLFCLFGKNSMLSMLKTDRFKNDIAFPERQPQLIDELIERIEWMITSKEGYLDSFHSSLVHLPTQGSLELLDEIATKAPELPILVLWGVYDLIIPYSFHTSVLQRIPKAKFVTIHDSSHAVLFDNPNSTQKEILEFLNNVV